MTRDRIVLVAAGIAVVFGFLAVIAGIAGYIIMPKPQESVLGFTAEPEGWTDSPVGDPRLRFVAEVILGVFLIVTGVALVDRKRWARPALESCVWIIVLGMVGFGHGWLR